MHLTLPIRPLLLLAALAGSADAAAAAIAPRPQDPGGRAAAGAGGRRNAENPIWYSNPGSRGAPGPGDRVAGTVGWRSSPRLMDMYAGAGFGRGAYRRTLMVHELAANVSYIGADFAEAAANGRVRWLTCVGTPSELSPHPEQTENEYNTGLPQYARYAPTDPVAWADLLVDFLADMEAEYGATADYLEIWNEPERVEWFIGSSAELFAFYSAAAARLQAARPGLKVGGPGLAGASSPMDGAESVLLALVRHAAASGAPLDFVSWHHYAPANELLATGMIADLRALGASLGLPRFETVVSEWNIYPAAQGAHGPEFDGSHAAANYAGFVSTAATLGLDRNLFFLDLDENNDPGITDLSGVGLGMLTHHGIKKPVMRLSEILLGMARETALAVLHPAEEFSVRVAASRSGNRVRYVVSNDAVNGTWVFALRSRQHGMLPGWLHPLWLAAGGTQATEATLMAQGLTLAQAQAVLGFIPEVLRADRYTREARPVTLTLTGTAAFQLGEVRRFTAAVNAPALHRAAILPYLEASEEDAWWEAAVAVADCLNQRGYSYTAQDIADIQIDFFDWADQEGIAFGDAVAANRVMNEAVRDGRLANQALLNGLPELRVQVESAAQAGITRSGRTLSFTLEPNAVLVLDLLL